MSNTDKIVDYVLKNTAKLEADKIKALASVIKSLGGEKIQSPNKIKDEPDEMISEDNPIDFSQVKNVQIPGMPKQKLKIYNT